MSIELRKHQLKALARLDNGKILCGGVGTGKTLTSLAYFFTRECGGTLSFNGKGETGALKTPKDLYVITTAKKRDSGDWPQEAANFGLSTDREASFGGVGVTVDSWQNIEKYADVKDAFFIFDEQRLVGAGAWTKAFLKIAKANRWILLSATPGDVWMDYVPVFVANGFYRNRTEFIAYHVAYRRFGSYPQIDRYVETGKLEEFRKQLLVDMPYEGHTKRHVNYRFVDYDKAKYDTVFKKRWNVFTDKPVKQISELFATLRRVLFSDVSRIGETMMILEKHPKLIVFYNFDFELDALRVLANTLNYPVGEWNGHKHQEIPDGDRWLYLVQYTAGSDAWNCITTDAMLFYSQNYSWRIMEQCMGRIDRMNTPFVDLWYYVLRSASPLDSAIAKTVSTKGTFNEKGFLAAQSVTKL